MTDHSTTLQLTPATENTQDGPPSTLQPTHDGSKPHHNRTTILQLHTLRRPTPAKADSQPVLSILNRTLPARDSTARDQRVPAIQHGASEVPSKPQNHATNGPVPFPVSTNRPYDPKRPTNLRTHQHRPLEQNLHPKNLR